MSRDKAASGVTTTLAVVGAVTFAAVCCGGAPIALGAIAGVGLGGLLGGLVGALIVAAAVVGLLVLRRARHAGRRRTPTAGHCRTPLRGEAPARERAGVP